MAFSYFKRIVKIRISKYFERQLYYFEKKRIQKVSRRTNELILVYSIGKVGSTSVYESLKQNKNLKSPVFHIHSLNPTRIESQKEYYKSSRRKSIPFHLIQGSVLSGILPDFKGKINIFTLVREPIQRELSSLFQDSFNFTDSKNLRDSQMEKVVEEKLSVLVKSLPEEKWFDQELKKVFDIDIFSESFDPSKGYMILKKENVNVAFVRLENLDDQLGKIGKKLFGRDYGLKVFKSNNSANKFYNKDYNTIKNQTNFSNEDLEEIIKTKFIQKFYSDYIGFLKQRWGRESPKTTQIRRDDIVLLIILNKA